MFSMCTYSISHSKICDLKNTESMYGRNTHFRWVLVVILKHMAYKLFLVLANRVDIWNMGRLVAQGPHARACNDVTLFGATHFDFMRTRKCHHDFLCSGNSVSKSTNHTVARRCQVSARACRDKIKQSTRASEMRQSIEDSAALLGC